MKCILIEKAISILSIDSIFTAKLINFWEPQFLFFMKSHKINYLTQNFKRIELNDLKNTLR